MRLDSFPERPDWRERFEALGFAYHSFDGAYWIDTIGLALSDREMRAIERAALEAHALGLEVVDQACRRGDFQDWGLAPDAIELICQSWSRRDFSLYGRFDLTFDAQGVPKFYEYNADTPTSIMEAGVAQLDWARARGLSSACWLDQTMPKAFSKLASLGASRIAIAGMSSSIEDTSNLLPLVDWAQQGGLSASLQAIETMEYHSDSDLHGFEDQPYDWIFKLYPWEYIFKESMPLFSRTRTHFLEPAWKALLSSKAFMAKAWAIAPNHPNLLPCYFEGREGPGLEAGRAIKPIWSREGANILLLGADGAPLQSESGPYGLEPRIAQAFCPMPEPAPGKRFTIGAWINDGRFAGSCARFTDDLVVTNVSQTCACYRE